jgi:hypothetical protein
MAKEVKFTDDELEQLQGLQTSYQEKQLQFGQLKVQKILLEQQTEASEEAEVRLEEDYKVVQETERKLVQQLNEKYGPGSLNPETGVFTPTETTETTKDS